MEAIIDFILGPSDKLRAVAEQHFQILFFFIKATAIYPKLLDHAQLKDLPFNHPKKPSSTSPSLPDRKENKNFFFFTFKTTENKKDFFQSKRDVNK